MGIVYLRPDDTFYYYSFISTEGSYPNTAYYLHRELMNYGVTINFPTGYIDYRLGYTNDPNNPYTYTFLRSNLQDNELTYYRLQKGELYNTDSDNHNGGNHTFTYELDHADSSYKFYKIYSDQHIEIHDDDGQGGGGADWRYYESTDILAVPADASTADIVGCINSYIAKCTFSANVHDDYYYSAYRGNLNKEVLRYRIKYGEVLLDDGRIIYALGVAVTPLFVYYSTNNIVQPNGNENWYVSSVDNWHFVADSEPLSGHMVPYTPIPGTVNENNVQRNYYPLANVLDDSTYPYTISATVCGSDVVLSKSKYGYSSGGGFVQLTLADGYPDNKVHWQYRYIDNNKKINWFTSVESFTPSYDNIRQEYKVSPNNPLSANFYGLKTKPFGATNLTSLI